MDTAPLGFVLQPKSSAWDVLYSRVATFFVVLFAVVVLFPVLLLVAVQLGMDPTWWDTLTVEDRGMVMALAPVVGLCAACIYPVALPPQAILERKAPGATLAAHSAGLLSWALGQAASQGLPKEPTSWSVDWRCNPFGVHAHEVKVTDVSGRTILKWAFPDLPEAVRFAAWEGVLRIKPDSFLSLVYTAALPVCTAHVRMQIARLALDIPKPRAQGVCAPPVVSMAQA